MNFSFYTNLSPTQLEMLLFDDIKEQLNKHHFLTEKSRDRLLFERKSKPGGQIRLIIELSKSFTKGQIYLDDQNPGKIICQLDYTKHLSVCLVQSLVVGLMFSWIQGFNWMDVLRIFSPVFMITMFGGVLIGNARLKRLLHQAIKK